MKKFYLNLNKVMMFLIVVLYAIETQGQDFDYQPKTNIRASYQGAILYPGFKVGL